MCVSKSNQMFWKIKHLNENKPFQTKSIKKTHWIQNRWIEQKMFEIKYAASKLTNVWKCKWVRLVHAAFAASSMQEGRKKILSHFSFEQESNDKMVKARCPGNISKYFVFSYILLLYHSPKGSWNKLQNMRSSENISHITRR